MTPPIDPTPLSPAERRRRNREEITATILAAARAVMEEHGVAALNLNEVARRVHLRPQSLSEYFSNKAALYDALALDAYSMFRDGEERAYSEHSPGWNQIEAWFESRIKLSVANPIAYHLGFDAPVPDYTPSDQAMDLARSMLARSRRMVADAIETGTVNPGVPLEQATDILLALRRGLTAEQIGKRRFLGADTKRFDELLPVVMDMLRTAWSPASDPVGAGHEDLNRENADA